MAIIDDLDKKETKFRETLKDSNGKVFKLVGTEEIGDGIKIYTLQSTDRSYYYTTKAKKTQICLHFTVGTIAGDIATLTKPGNKVSVHYVVDRQGNIYNIIPLDSEHNWSYHLGANCVGTNSVMSKSAIGIEVSNYGPLNKHTSGYYNAYQQLYCTEDKHVDEFSFRGYYHYARLTKAQQDAIYALVNWLCDKCGIPHNYKLEGMFENDKAAQEFKGVFTHTQVRKDKFDFPPDQISFVKTRWEDSQLPPIREMTEPVKESDIVFSEVRQKQPAEEQRCVDPASTVKAEPVKSKSLLATLFDMIFGIFAKTGK